MLTDCAAAVSLSLYTHRQEGSVIPALLASLLTKDYNVDLIRAVRDKIITYAICHEVLIHPLIALVKDGTTQVATYALHALTLLAKYHPQQLIDAGGATLAMWYVFVSKHELLLAAAMDLILELCNCSEANKSLFAQQAFAKKLVELLRLRVGQQRYAMAVLQKCALIIW